MHLACTFIDNIYICMFINFIKTKIKQYFRIKYLSKFYMNVTHDMNHLIYLCQIFNTLIKLFFLILLNNNIISPISFLYTNNGIHNILNHTLDTLNFSKQLILCKHYKTFDGRVCRNNFFSPIKTGYNYKLDLKYRSSFLIII